MNLLTDEEIKMLIGNVADIGGGIRIARAIEAAVLAKVGKVEDKCRDGSCDCCWTEKLTKADVEPVMPAPYAPAVYANSRNTDAVRKGYEMGGYLKTPDLYTKAQMLEYTASALAAEQAKVRELVEVLRKCQPYVEQALDVVGGMDEYHAVTGLHTAIAKYGEQK